MRPAIRITLNDPAPEIVPRFRDFAEDVYRALRDVCVVELDEIDGATSTFMVREIRRQDVGTVTDALRRVIRQYRWEDVVSLVRNDGERRAR